MLIITWGEYLSIWRFRFTQSFCKLPTSKFVVTGFGDFYTCSFWDSLSYTQYCPLAISSLFFFTLFMWSITQELWVLYMWPCANGDGHTLACFVVSVKWSLCSPQSPFTASGLSIGWKRHRLYLASSQTKQLKHKHHVIHSLKSSHSSLISIKSIPHSV